MKYYAQFNQAQFPGMTPIPPGQPAPGGWCGPQTKMPCASMVSPQTEAALRGANRSASYTAAIASLGVGAAATFATVVSPGVDTLTSNSMWRTVQVVDLIGSLSGGLDDVHVNIYVSGILRGDFNGGIFSRGNANNCTPACGISICAGPMESIRIEAVNQTGAAFAASATIKISTRTVYSGEPGFTCSPDGCVDPGAPVVVTMTDPAACDCGGGL